MPAQPQRGGMFIAVGRPHARPAPAGRHVYSRGPTSCPPSPSGAAWKCALRTCDKNVSMPLLAELAGSPRLVVSINISLLTELGSLGRRSAINRSPLPGFPLRLSASLFFKKSRPLRGVSSSIANGIVVSSFAPPGLTGPVRSALARRPGQTGSALLFLLTDLGRGRGGTR